VLFVGSGVGGTIDIGGARENEEVTAPSLDNVGGLLGALNAGRSGRSSGSFTEGDGIGALFDVLGLVNENGKAVTGGSFAVLKSFWIGAAFIMLYQYAIIQRHV
jgi:hypothetical protein